MHIRDITLKIFPIKHYEIKTILKESESIIVVSLLYSCYEVFINEN